MSNAKLLGQWMLLGGLTLIVVGGVGVLRNLPLSKPANIGILDDIAYELNMSDERARRSSARSGAIGIIFLGVVAAALGATLQAGASPKPDKALSPETGSVEEFIRNAKVAGLGALRAFRRNYTATLEAKSHLSPSSRPAGIALIALYTAFSGAFSLLGTTLAIGSSLSLATALYAVAVMVAGILSLVAAYGLWMLVPWGYYLSILIRLASIPFSFLGLLLGQKACGSLILALFLFVIEVTILRYLSIPRVRGYFVPEGIEALNPIAPADQKAPLPGR